MSTEKLDISNALETHIRRFFDGHECTKRTFKHGPIVTVLPNFKILEISPGPNSELWNYISIGAWEIKHPGYTVQEFLLATTEKHDCQIEYLAMIAHYHQYEKLDIGHTIPLGRPWLPNSNLDNLLVSTPYPYGPELEIFESNEFHLHINWLLPITESEKIFRHENGLESLEQLFDDNELKFWDEHRSSVI